MRALICACAAALARGAAAAAEPALVDVNRASRAELMALPGIGAAQAERIVAHRPYITKTHLVEKKALSLPEYDAIRKRVVVVHKAAAVKKAAQ